MLRVEELRKNSIIVRGHSDVYEIAERFNRGEEHPIADAWLPRLQRSNVDIVWLAVSGDKLAHTNGDPRRLHGALSMLDIAINDEQFSVGKMKIIRSKSDLPEKSTEGVTHFLLSLEGGGPLQKSLANLRHFYRLGIRVMQITHNMRNELADGVGDDTGGGLSKFGKEVIKEMNRLGMIVDLAHLSPHAFDEALELSEYPVVNSHGNVKAIQNHPRNLTDEGLKRLAEKGGLTGILFLKDFVNEGIAKIEKYVDHIDYIAQKVGIEHVGVGHLGLDKDLSEVFKTVTSGHYSRYRDLTQKGFPPNLQDINQFNALIEELIQRGYKDEDIKLILGGNFLRVIRQVLK